MTNPTPEARRRIATLSAKGLCRRYHGADCDCWQAEYQPARDTCHIDDCSSVVKGHGLCAMHYMRWVKYGDPYWTAWHETLRADISYTTAHQRVTKKRGPASAHPCTDCDQPAYDWSYIGGCPQEQHDNRHGSPYSPDPTRYEPRCRSCHRTFDHQQRTSSVEAQQ